MLVLLWLVCCQAGYWRRTRQHPADREDLASVKAHLSACYKDTIDCSFWLKVLKQRTGRRVQSYGGREGDGWVI